MQGCVVTTKEAPEKISLTAEEAEGLKSRVQKNQLSLADIKLVTGLIAFNLWLQNQLNLAKLSIHRLKQFFGMSTEKKSPTDR